LSIFPLLKLKIQKESHLFQPLQYGLSEHRRRYGKREEQADSIGILVVEVKDIQVGLLFRLHKLDVLEKVSIQIGVALPKICQVLLVEHDKNDPSVVAFDIPFLSELLVQHGDDTQSFPIDRFYNMGLDSRQFGDSPGMIHISHPPA